jgi:hypothetical protein
VNSKIGTAAVKMDQLVNAGKAFCEEAQTLPLFLKSVRSIKFSVWERGSPGPECILHVQSQVGEANATGPSSDRNAGPANAVQHLASMTRLLGEERKPDLLNFLKSQISNTEQEPMCALTTSTITVQYHDPAQTAAPHKSYQTYLVSTQLGVSPREQPQQPAQKSLSPLEYVSLFSLFALN